MDTMEAGRIKFGRQANGLEQIPVWCFGFDVGTQP